MSKREEAFVTIVCCYNDSGQYEAKIFYFSNVARSYRKFLKLMREYE